MAGVARTVRLADWVTADESITVTTSVPGAVVGVTTTAAFAGMLPKASVVIVVVFAVVAGLYH